MKRSEFLKQKETVKRMRATADRAEAKLNAASVIAVSKLTQQGYVRNAECLTANNDTAYILFNQPVSTTKDGYKVIATSRDLDVTYNGEDLTDDYVGVYDDPIEVITEFFTIVCKNGRIK